MSTPQITPTSSVIPQTTPAPRRQTLPRPAVTRSPFWGSTPATHRSQSVCLSRGRRPRRGPWWAPTARWPWRPPRTARGCCWRRGPPGDCRPRAGRCPGPRGPTDIKLPVNTDSDGRSAMPSGWHFQCLINNDGLVYDVHGIPRVRSLFHACLTTSRRSML